MRAAGRKKDMPRVPSFLFLAPSFFFVLLLNVLTSKKEYFMGALLFVCTPVESQGESGGGMLLCKTRHQQHEGCAAFVPPFASLGVSRWRGVVVIEGGSSAGRRVMRCPALLRLFPFFCCNNKLNLVRQQNNAAIARLGEGEGNAERAR